MATINLTDPDVTHKLLDDYQLYPDEQLLKQTEADEQLAEQLTGQVKQA
jgi:hypothetical protein